VVHEDHQADLCRDVSQQPFIGFYWSDNLRSSVLLFWELQVRPLWYCSTTVRLHQLTSYSMVSPSRRL